MAKIVNFVQALIIFFSLIVLATGDYRVFCSTTNDCQYNDCGPAYVPECIWILSAIIVCSALLTKIVNTMNVAQLMFLSAFGLFVPANLG
ncbi:hypothetical protein P8452_40576 [Trifolium repens]|nr:hypothetical protein P8452_40576 [Trifolium repens]